MKILIIGSKGFIGSHCVTYFMQQHQVWECDVVTDYNNENYFLIEATNADYTELFEQQKFDVCINPLKPLIKNGRFLTQLASPTYNKNLSGKLNFRLTRKRLVSLSTLNSISAARGIEKTFLSFKFKYLSISFLVNLSLLIISGSRICLSAGL